MSTSSFLLPVLLLAATATAAATAVMPGCQASCGGVDIPFPFGIGNGYCFRKGFEIACVRNGSAGNDDVPVLVTTATSQQQAIRVLSLSVAPRPQARVLLPVSWQCFNSTGDVTGSFYGDVNVNPQGVYRISDTRNELYVLGCNTFAYTKNGARGRFSYSFYTGCVAFSNDSSGPRDGACAGVGCCHVDIPPGLTDNTMEMKSGSGGAWTHADQEFCPCDYAFIVERGAYTFRAADLTGGGMRRMPTNQTMPLVLDWAIRDDGSTSASCARAAKSPGYACVSNHSECIDSDNGPGYLCNCTKGYEGNPYIVGGCTNINECARPELFSCHGVCKDTEGSYDCRCRPGYESGGDDPKEAPCRPKLSHSAKLAIGITVGTFLIILIVLGIGIRWRIKRIELNAIEKKNGSELLKNVKTLEIFTKEELDKITKNNAEPLGEGGFGKVYKGILRDKRDKKTVVAVKASIEVTEATRNEFVKEVEIQSKMMHRNILKLIGCCLRVDVPLLVYEYAAKGSLQDILHGKDSDTQQESLPLNIRLDIAIGAAQGLAYMHSYTEDGIQHADVKPDNILLDGGLIPKISDFGLSKVFRPDKHRTSNVIGFLPYMDPVYEDTGVITPKSDVYSFGIVLLELISRKPVGYGESSLITQFKKAYEHDKSARALFDTDIAKEEDIPVLEEIGKLAMKCLKGKVEERPAMVSVASALVMLKNSWEEEKEQRFSAASGN